MPIQNISGIPTVAYNDTEDKLMTMNYVQNSSSIWVPKSANLQVSDADVDNNNPVPTTLSGSIPAGINKIGEVSKQQKICYIADNLTVGAGLTSGYLTSFGNIYSEGMPGREITINGQADADHSWNAKYYWYIGKNGGGELYIGVGDTESTTNKYILGTWKDCKGTNPKFKITNNDASDHQYYLNAQTI